MRNAALALLILFVALFLAFLANGTSAQNADAVAQPRNWDYKVVYINKLVGDAKDDVTDIDEIVTGLQNGLKEQGDQGWELCLEINGGVVFKRPR